MKHYFIVTIIFLSFHVGAMASELIIPKKTLHLAYLDRPAVSDNWEEEFDEASEKKDVKKKEEPKTEEKKKKEEPDDLDEKIYETQSRLAVPEKSIYLAMTLSLFIGFGLGNFYADDPFPGYIDMITELVGVTVLAAGIGMYYYEEDTDLGDNVLAPSEGLLIGGGILFVGMRLYSTINSGFAAHAYNKRNRIKTLGMSPYYRKYNNNDAIGLAFRF